MVVVALETEEGGALAKYLLVVDDEDVGAVEDATEEKVKPLGDCGILLCWEVTKGLLSLSR